jgi:hypothetical protein
MHSNDESKELQLPPELEKAVKQMRDAKPVVTLYPWPDMKVGDSILFQAEGGESIEVLRRRVGVSVYHYGKASGKQFTTKLLSDENGFRVWRTE